MRPSESGSDADENTAPRAVRAGGCDVEGTELSAPPTELVDCQETLRVWSNPVAPPTWIRVPKRHTRR